MAVPRVAGYRTAMISRAGLTTLELLCVLTLLSVAAGIAAPGFFHALDVLSVRAARDVIVTAAVQTRSAAVARGGAYLRVAEDGGVAVLQRDSTQRFSWQLRERYGIALDIENSARSIVLLEYDALGVGRLANLTVRVRRGRASGAITFSAYGRPRTW